MPSVQDLQGRRGAVHYCQRRDANFMKFPSWLTVVEGNLADDSKEVTVLLAEPIGEDWTGEGMSSRSFGEALNAIPRHKKITIDINSLGGRVDDGMAMHNMIVARGN